MIINVHFVPVDEGGNEPVADIEIFSIEQFVWLELANRIHLNLVSKLSNYMGPPQYGADLLTLL